jgi:hypothetical protein
VFLTIHDRIAIALDFMSLQSPDSTRNQQDPSLSRSTPTLDDLLTEDAKLDLRAELVPYFFSETLKRLTEKGFVQHTELGYVYKKDWGPLYVRRESPQRLVKALSTNTPIDLSFHGGFGSGDKYLNSAVFDSSGPEADTIQWSIMEGWSKAGGMYSVVGFDRSAQVEEHKLNIPQEELFRRFPDGSVMDRTYFRSLSGSIRPSDIRFILLGVPAQRCPTEIMTGEERHQFEAWKEAISEWKQEDNPTRPRPDPFYIIRTFVPARGEASSSSVLEN